MDKESRALPMALGWLLCCCALASAQQPQMPGPAAAAAFRSEGAVAEKPRLEESRPPIFYLPDKQGNLQAVLDFPYQEFVELYRLRNELDRPNLPPQCTLQRLVASGMARREFVELTIECQVALRDSGWVRLPLRLEQALLRDVRYKGAGMHLLQYEGEGVGNVCWIRGRPDSQHEIHLTALVPVDIVGDETRLRLSMPRATASEMTLVVPVPGALVTTSENATFASSSTADGATRFHIVGLDKDFHMAWRLPGPGVEQATSMLESIATLRARFDGRAITTDAKLAVRSLGAPFDRFLMRLPPDSDLVADSVRGFALVPLPPGDGDQGQRLFELRLPRKTLGPVEIELRCRRNYDPRVDSSWCDLAGFDVVGAARQSGTVTIAFVANQWHMLSTPNAQTRPLEPAADSLPSEDIAASFEYSSQPFSLPIRFLPRDSRVQVAPEYLLLVERDRLVLEGRLKYTIRGEDVSHLELRLPEWEFDHIGPDGVVATDAVKKSGDLLMVPLVRPMSGSLELQFRAHRAVAPTATAFVVPLPCPEKAALSPANLVVLAADNIELTPNAGLSAGIMRQSKAPAMRLPLRQHEPLLYLLASEEARFAADFLVLPQKITVDAASRILLARDNAAVEQRYSYEIAHEPVRHLTIFAPRLLATGNQLEILHEGKPLVPRVSVDLTRGDPMTPVPLRVSLPEPRIGPFQLLVRYHFPVLPEAIGGQEMVDVPLPMPGDGKLADNRIFVKGEQSVQATLRNDAWTWVDPEAAFHDLKKGLRLVASKRAYSLGLDLGWEGTTTTDAAVVDRAWIQTWLASEKRQDRAVFQLTSDFEEFEVLLPAGAAGDQAAVLVDGKSVSPRLVEGNRLHVPLAGSQNGQPRRFVIEIQYHFSEPRRSQGRLLLEFPQLPQGAWIRRIYWQLVLPLHEHLVVTPKNLTGEFAWHWYGWLWGRHPSLDQAQLEAWTGAASSPAASEQTNTYLFGAIGSLTPTEIRTIDRTWLVLGASGVALFLSLLLLHARMVRHPAVLLVGAAAILAVGLQWPEAAVLVAQSAVLGLLLAFFAGFLQRRISQRHWHTVRDSSSSLVQFGPWPGDSAAPTPSEPTSTESMFVKPASASEDSER